MPNLRFAIFGTGFWAHFQLAAWQELKGVECVAIYNRTRSRGEQFACCGSSGLLIKARLLFEQRNPQQKSKAPKLYGQELNGVTLAIAKMNMFLHDYTDSFFAPADTFKNPGFAIEGTGLKRFHYVVANPMWNQDRYDEAFYENETWGRFAHGTPPSSSADWGWAQHMLASLNDKGRAAIVLDTGAVSRGSGSKSSNRERDIRKGFVENDFVEGVILLPENLFYNTTAPGIIMLLNRAKPAERKGQILLILSPAQFVEVNSRVQRRPLREILANLERARAQREKADSDLATLLATLNLNGE